LYPNARAQKNDGAFERFYRATGRDGTFDYLFDVLSQAQLGLHGKSCGLLDFLGYYESLVAFLDHSMK
jgi:predicted Rossmann-fold nucleotide-binding protein